MRPNAGRLAYYLRIAPRYLLPVLTVLSVSALALLVGVKIRRRLPPGLPANRLIIKVVNVGHGEATWIRTPGGKFILIGGGPPTPHNTVIQSLKNAQAKRIDLLILPYPYAEVLGGLPDVIRQFPVMEAWEPGGPDINQWQTQVHQILTSMNVPTKAVVAGESVVMDGVRIEALAPFDPPIKEAPVAANNSVVVRVTFGKTRFLWAGGLERQGEISLLSHQTDLSANWLRVARFATKNASSPEFLRRVSPEIAVVSVGPNRSGYPHPETMKRLDATGAVVYRTDTQATSLQFVSNGVSITLPQ